MMQEPAMQTQQPQGERPGEAGTVPAPSGTGVGYQPAGGVPVTLTPEQAATLIQAQFRGHQVRQAMQPTAPQQQQQYAVQQSTAPQQQYAVQPTAPQQQQQQYAVQQPSLADQRAARMERLRQTTQQLEISLDMVHDLRSLEDYEIVVIADDSGSMNARVQASSDPFAPPTTRWDELKATMGIIVQLATALDDDGIDLYFLNRQPVRKITSPEMVGQAFVERPAGFTPLVDAMKMVVSEKLSRESKPLLMIIATDGVPSTRDGRDDRAGFAQWLRARDATRVRVSILACSDRDEDVGYLNKLDTGIKFVDVSDDYTTEAAGVAKRNSSMRFTRGDYVAKALLGPVLSKYDQADEAHVGQMATPQASESGGSCCIVM